MAGSLKDPSVVDVDDVVMRAMKDEERLPEVVDHIEETMFLQVVEQLLPDAERAPTDRHFRLTRLGDLVHRRAQQAGDVRRVGRGLDQRGASEPGRGTGREGGVSFTDAASETPPESTTATVVAYETIAIEPETMIVGVVDKVALVVLSAKAEITRPGRRASLSPAHPIGGEQD